MPFFLMIIAKASFETNRSILSVLQDKKDLAALYEGSNQDPQNIYEDIKKLRDQVGIW
jgi:hypothetical protein